MDSAQSVVLVLIDHRNTLLVIARFMRHLNAKLI